MFPHCFADNTIKFTVVRQYDWFVNVRLYERLGELYDELAKNDFSAGEVKFIR